MKNTIFEDVVLLSVNLALFDAGDSNMNTTASEGLSAEMRTYYSDYLIDMAEPELVHDQFGQKQPIPKNGGTTIQFRKYKPLPKQLTPLTEGVTPEGQSLNVVPLDATVKQYGGYVTLTDMLLMAAVDNNLVQATRLLGSQAGRTLDTITREVINGGTNVLRPNNKSERKDIADEGDILTVDLVKRAVRILKIMNAPKIDGYYVGIIHPDCAYDLMNDSAWVEAHKYTTPENIYEGEIGKIAGVRFVEATEAKVFAKTTANAQQVDVYSTLILGADAYGVTEISGGGLEHIVKQLGSAGASDPLNQRATVGWKATRTAKRLVEEYMCRIETASTFEISKDITDVKTETVTIEELTSKADGKPGHEF